MLIQNWWELYIIASCILIYAIEVWGSADDTHLNKLLILQKRIVRVITHSDKRLLDYSFLPSDPLFFKLEIHKIHEIFKIMVVKFIFKCLNKTNPTTFHSWYILTSQVHKHNTKVRLLILCMWGGPTHNCQSFCPPKTSNPSFDSWDRA